MSDSKQSLVPPETVELKSFVSVVQVETEEVETEEEKPESEATGETPQAVHSIDIPEIIIQPSNEEPPRESPNSGKRVGEMSGESDKTKLSQVIHDGPIDCGHCSDVFIELLELSSNGLLWKEKARWIKYEENVEPSGNWGRPFLSYVECESLRQLRRCIETGLVSLGIVNDGGFNISHTIADMLVLGGYAEPQHRVRLQQIITLPRMHQGESTARFRKKVHLRRKCLTIEVQRRQAVMARAWKFSDNDVRNRWVRLARMALDQHRKENPDAERIREHVLSRENCPEKYLFNEHGVLQITSETNLLPNLHIAADSSSVASEFSNVSYLIDNDFDAVQSRDLPMTTEQAKLKKIVHPNSKGIVVYHASVDFLKRDKCLSAFIRYSNEKPIVDSMEITLPIKFVYILITSKHTVHADGYQICRSMATLFQDKAFRQCAIQAKTCADLSNAFFMFIDGSVMLPPGNWKPELLTPIAGAISEITRKKHALRKFKCRNGKLLWRIVRTKIRVIAIMKDLVQSRELRNGVIVAMEESQETDDQVEASTTTYFPRRGDCPIRTKLCKLRRRFTSKRISGTDKKTDVSRIEDTDADDNGDDDDDGDNGDKELTEVHPLHPDGRWFGGLRRELVRRYPMYWSDIKNGLHIQCLATLLYLSISLIAMCLTYGQVIAKYTKNYLGASEMLLGTAISCILMAIIGTEPLAVIAGTAAMLVFESSTYQVADSVDLNFMQFRWLTGMWIFVFIMLILAFDKTHWIHYCTRFTEEILHVLVALLFMYEGIKNLLKVYDKHPLREEYSTVPSNNSSVVINIAKPNTALLYTIIMFATFGIALGFRLFEKTRFFSPRVRRLLNFFSIPVAVNVMNAITYVVSVYLKTILIPERLQLTDPEKRGRYILPDIDDISKGTLSYGIIPFTAIPALLTVILLFIESEITLLECFKETRGRKGSGFHVNLFVVAIMVLFSSFFGLPWMCLAAVETSVHLDSLKVWSSFDAPGVKSHVVKIREQRLTLLFTGILVGLSSLLHSYLDHIPEAVFSGMVLYMGVVALFGVQMVERFFLMFMAPGQHPDIPYLKNVPLLKVYLFTIIQIIFVVVLWTVKSIKTISPIFPLVILLMIPIRVLLGKVFNPEHIEQLDNEEEEEGHGPLD